MNLITVNARTAAEMTGLSVDVIKRAIRHGDLRASRPRINGRHVERDVIAVEDLTRWAKDVAAP